MDNSNLIREMIRAHYTFEDIINLNKKDWDKAYAVLQACLESGHLVKEIRGYEDIIYRPASGIEDKNLMHDSVTEEEIQRQGNFRKRSDF
jgi:hypothetical protein